MAAKATAIDVGSHSIKVIQVRGGKGQLAVLRFAAVRTGENGDLRGLGIPLQGAVAGLAGRDMTLRYTQVPPTSDWQLRNLMELEIQDLSAQSGGSLSADYNLLPITDEASGMDTVLMALARNDALEQVGAKVRAAGGNVVAHVPNCVALYNAFLRAGPVEPDAVVALANLGHETIDIALVRGTELLFARNLSSGGKALDEAIAQTFNVSPRKAESLKRDLLDLDPASRGRYASGQAEKVTMAAIGASGTLIAALQSSLAFCKAQTKIQDLKLDKILLAGGSARVRGVKGLLREAMRCPVETFDPFANTDLAALPPDEAQLLEEYRSEAVIAFGLAAGRLDQTLYALEILPEATKRKQRFFQRTIWNVAAALVGVGLLAWFAVNAKNQVAAAQTVGSRLKREFVAAQQVHNDTVKAIAENEKTREKLAALGKRSVPLDGLLKALRAVHASLVPEVWVTRVEVKPSTGRGTGTGEPEIEVSGSVKALAGASVGDQYREFNQRVSKHKELEHAKLKPVVKDPSDKLTTFTFTIEYPPPAPVEGKGTETKGNETPKGK